MSDETPTTPPAPFETVHFVGGPMDGYDPQVEPGAYGDRYEFVTGDGTTTVYVREGDTYTAEE